ncbi:hypothetical protein L2E82_36309 [Cichorium intybus]|uniref:Uncharacterized protein n=1 Tax=Cichorium intybus TaxID=13427 RepID=A0ACB9BR59_CICIN|nr:hypothetical protein L2E82_36309 [Cichorium intybus]
MFLGLQDELHRPVPDSLFWETDQEKKKNLGLFILSEWAELEIRSWPWLSFKDNKVWDLEEGMGRAQNSLKLRFDVLTDSVSSNALHIVPSLKKMSNNALHIVPSLRKMSSNALHIVPYLRKTSSNALHIVPYLKKTRL